MKRLVGDQPAVEGGTEDAAVDAWPTADGQVLYMFLMLLNQLGNPLQVFRSLVLLGFLPLLIVHIHKGQADIRLRHQQRESGIERDAFFGQHVTEDVHGFAYRVTGSAERIDIVPGGIDDELFHEVNDDARRTPAMDREAKADVLARFQLSGERPSAVLGDVDEPVAGVEAQLFGGPGGVACCGEEKDHECCLVNFARENRLPPTPQG